MAGRNKSSQLSNAIKGTVQTIASLALIASSAAVASAKSILEVTTASQSYSTETPIQNSTEISGDNNSESALLAGATVAGASVMLATCAAVACYCCRNNSKDEASREREDNNPGTEMSVTSTTSQQPGVSKTDPRHPSYS